MPRSRFISTRRGVLSRMRGPSHEPCGMSWGRQRAELDRLADKIRDGAVRLHPFEHIGRLAQPLIDVGACGHPSAGEAPPSALFRAGLAVFRRGLLRRSGPFILRIFSGEGGALGEGRHAEVGHGPAATAARRSVSKRRERVDSAVGPGNHLDDFLACYARGALDGLVEGLAP